MDDLQGWIGVSLPRVDALHKVSGKTKYAADIHVDGAVWIKVVRSPYPHALIKGIDISRARNHPGVFNVFTHEDISGSNAFGSYVQDQPVLCHEKARCVGDPVALVVAETPEAAAEAVSLVSVNYEPLTLVTDPVDAVRDDSAKVHKSGNAQSKLSIKRGNVEQGFKNSEVIVEKAYYPSGRQSSAYIETEAGVALPQGDGIVVYATTQSPYEDQFQISRALGIPEEKLRIVAPPIGGGFGGKCDITVQAHLALAAHKTGRAVRMVWSREESLTMGYKRHPMVIYLKTGASAKGELLANQAKVYADTGAYASRGPSVLTVALESCCGPYRVENLDAEGFCVYTNNGVSGALNGFGVPQMSFALESQMELLAVALHLTPIEIKRLNALRPGDIAPLGYEVKESCGYLQTIERIEQGNLWRNREQLKAKSTMPWIRRGIGVASAKKGGGFQLRTGDRGTAALRISKDGKFTVALSCPEIGQGNITAYTQITAQALHCDTQDVTVTLGDTHNTPNTGSSIASRSIIVGGSAIINAASKMLQLLVDIASRLSGHPAESFRCHEGSVTSGSTAYAYRELARELCREREYIEAVGDFALPRYDSASSTTDSGLPYSHTIYSYATEAVLVEVDTLTGKVDVLDVECALDCGTIINKQGFEGQAECDIAMGLGYALLEDVITEYGMVKAPNLTCYILPTAMDSPKMTVSSVGIPESVGPFGAKSVGEMTISPLAAAISNAVTDAVGVRLFSLPLTPERVFRALKEGGFRS